MFVIKSKANKDRKDLAGMVWAHGGGAVIGDAIAENIMNCQVALNNDVVVFNVNYRLAPEHKSPAGA